MKLLPLTERRLLLAQEYVFFILCQPLIIQAGNGASEISLDASDMGRPVFTKSLALRHLAKP